MSTYALRTGMDVFASDGQKLGSIKSLFSASPASRQTGDAATDEDVGNAATDASPGAGEDTWNLIEEMPPATAPSGAPSSQVATSGNDPAQSYGVGALAVGNRQTYSDADAGGSDVGPKFTPSDTKYIEVQHGGILGIGGESLYVPYSAFDAVSDDSVTLKYSQAEATRMFSTKPDQMTPDEEEA